MPCGCSRCEWSRYFMSATDAVLSLGIGMRTHWSPRTLPRRGRLARRGAQPDGSGAAGHPRAAPSLGWTPTTVAPADWVVTGAPCVEQLPAPQTPYSPSPPLCRPCSRHCRPPFVTAAHCAPRLCRGSSGHPSLLSRQLRRRRPASPQPQEAPAALTPRLLPSAFRRGRLPPPYSPSWLPPLATATAAGQRPSPPLRPLPVAPAGARCASPAASTGASDGRGGHRQQLQRPCRSRPPRFAREICEPGVRPPPTRGGNTPRR